MKVFDIDRGHSVGVDDPFRRPRSGEPVDDPFPQTEAGDAEFFARLAVNRFRYDHQRRLWYAFGPHHWRQDPIQHVVQAALDAMRRRQALALDVSDSADRTRRSKWALAGESETRLSHLLDLAASNPALALAGIEWDQDPWQLGVVNGVVDLRSGIVRPGRPGDHITRAAAVPYDPDARCERWRRFIAEVCDNAVTLAAFLQRSIGYALTAVTSEQCFWIMYGLGANGKSTLIETITAHVIPEHSWTVPFPVQTWSESLSEYQRAKLVGMRLVIAKESEQAKRLKTEFVKSLTGSETVNARHPYGRPFTFVPVAKVFLAANHRPIITDDTHGMWRRVRLVPFLRTFEIDTKLPDVLAAEAPGILTWVLDGCLAWQRDGLLVPETVTTATESYRHDSDTLQRFFDACCILGAACRVQAGALWTAYTGWCDTERLPPDQRLGRGTFLDRMRRTFTAHDGQRTTYTGIGLCTAAAEEPPDVA